MAAELQGKAKGKRMLNVALDPEITDWLVFVSSMADTSQAGYINQLLHKDLEGASDKRARAYQAWLEAREDL